MGRTLRKTLNALLLALWLTAVSFAVPAQAQSAGPALSLPTLIPEPVTLVLFGTGLAALAAAIATRRK
jgi:hypothetical protein